MAGMFEELYQDPLDKIEESARSQAALGGWGTIAASAGLAGGMLGRAGAKALGGTYEEDLVNDILLKGTHDTPEGQAATLQALSQVSPGAYMKVQKMYDDMNLSKQKVEEAQLDIEIKRDKLNLKQATPSLEKEYTNNQMTTDIINWMKMNTDLSKISEEDIASIITAGNAQDLLMKAYKGKSGAKWKELKEHLKTQKEEYVKNRYKGTTGTDTTTSTTTKVDQEVFGPRVVPTIVPTSDAITNDVDNIGGA